MLLWFRTLPIYDELCRWDMNFIHSYLHRDSYFVKSIVLNGISAELTDRTKCMRNFIQASNVLVLLNASKFAIIAWTLRRLLKVYVLREILMIRDGLLELSSDLFQLDDFFPSLTN